MRSAERTVRTPSHRKPKIHRDPHSKRWLLDWPNHDGTTHRRPYRDWQDAMDDALYWWTRQQQPLRII
jgi:hypothetical protein